MINVVYTGWQWRNFFIPIYASCSGRQDVGQGNVNILQHLQSDRRSGASIKLFLNQPIQFYLNNVTNLHRLTSQITTFKSDQIKAGLFQATWPIELIN